ncbi:uncharacterized protein [Halyomorpha halys]|uniref:uncharacterized protein n=1 Tax=Halyomorpha halys TaxID=286706 RepID=UPI0006D51230|nr:uncharacterized protein LOC106682698 [Halyomorpha halys]
MSKPRSVRGGYRRPSVCVRFCENRDELSQMDGSRRKLSVTPRDDIWLIKTLKDDMPRRHYEYKTLTRIYDFVEKITESWLKKLQAVRDVFEETIEKIVQQRQTEIYYSTCCLKEELQDIKDLLDKTENLEDSEGMNILRKTWFDTLYKWKADMFEMEERSSKFLRTAVSRYLSKLVTTRHSPCHTFDVMLALVLELNQIIMGNVQTIVETEHDLMLLWDTHFKDWCIDYYLRTGLEAIDLQEEEETVFEEEEIEIEGLAALDSILDLIVSFSKEGTSDRVEFSRPPDLIMIPHLVYLENYWNIFKEKEKVLLEVLESEAKKLICMKKFYSSLKPEQRVLFEEWTRDAGYGPEFEEKFIRAAEMAVLCIKELKSLMLRTAELWEDLTERLDAIKYIIEFLYYKRRLQNTAMFQEWEINMNLAVDELRQAHSLSVLENMWNIQIDRLFLEHKNLLIETLQNEKVTLDVYTPMSKLTFELFIRALDVLVNETNISNSEIIPETSFSSFDELELQKLDTMLSEIIITCVSNAGKGYIESLIFFRNEIQGNIDKLDTAWLKKKKADLDWQYTLKEEMIKHRMHRMKTDVLDIRANELKMHDEGLYRHLEAIRERLMYLSSIDVNLGIQPLLEEFHAAADKFANLNTKVSPRGFAKVIASMDQAKRKFVELCLRCDHDSMRAFEHIDRYFEWMEHINIQLLCDLKMFSEGGNFSSDEVAGFHFVIQRVDKEMSSEKKIIDTRFTKGLFLSDMEIGFKIDRFISYMKKTQSDLLNKRKMRLVLDRAKRAIKREIYNGRVLLKNVESILSSEAQNTTILPDLLEAAIRACAFLEIPSDLTDLTANISGKSSGISTQKQKSPLSSKSILKKITTSHQTIPKRTSVYLKFKSEDEDGPNNFLTKMVDIISKGKEALHHQIFNLTSQGLGQRSEQNTGVPLKSVIKAKVQKGNTIIQELESELNEIHRKSLIVWLDMVNDSLKLLTLFGNQVSIILNNEYKNFANIWLSSMKVLETQFHDELKEFDRGSMEYKEEMKRKLKTMFGHPMHKDLLQTLTDEALAFCKSQTQDLKTIILYRRNQVKQLLIMFTEEKKPFLKHLLEKVDKVYNSEDLEHILYKLVPHFIRKTKVKKITQHLLYPVGHKSRVAPKPEAKLEDDARSDSFDLSSTWKTDTDVIGLLIAISFRLTNILNIRDSEIEVEMDTEMEFVQEEPEAYVRLCKELRTALIRSAMKICQLGKLALAVYIEEMQNWLMDWRTDCTRLTELYTLDSNSTAKDKLSNPLHRHDHTSPPLTALSSTSRFAVHSHATSKR